MDVSQTKQIAILARMAYGQRRKEYKMGFIAWDFTAKNTPGNDRLNHGQVGSGEKALSAVVMKNTRVYK